MQGLTVLAKQARSVYSVAGERVTGNRRGARTLFPSWTSPVRIRSPALNVRPISRSTSAYPAAVAGAACPTGQPGTFPATLATGHHVRTHPPPPRPPRPPAPRAPTPGRPRSPLAGRAPPPGPSGPADSRGASRRLIAEWAEGKGRFAPAGPAPLSVNEVLLAYYKHATDYY